MTEKANPGTQEVEAQERPVFMVPMSDDDRYIADRMKSQPKTLDDVLFVKEEKYEPGEHRLSLPKEFRKYESRFAFRWVNKKKRAVDEAIYKGWVIVNRTLFKELADDKTAEYLFSTSGAVEKGDAILAFMARPKAEAIRRAPGEKSNEFLKSQMAKGEQKLEKGQSGFYKPDDSAEKETEKGGKGLQEGRDF